MSGSRLGVAVIGLGVGRQHAEAYLSCRNSDLLWLYDIDHRLAERVAAELGHGTAASSLRQVLGDPSVNVVSIASYDDAHAGQVIQSLKAGKHVFVEKPLCCSESDLESIKSVWSEKKSLRLASNLVLRSAPLYEWLRNAILADEFGDIFAFDGEYLYGRLNKITDGWRKDVEDYSVILGGGVHLVDIMMRCTAQKPDFVSCVGTRICSEGTSFRYSDYMAATYVFPSGMIGRITANFGCVHRHQHVVRVFGTKGTFLYDDQGARVYFSRNPGEAAKIVELSPLPATKGDLIPAFLESIEDESAIGNSQHEFDLISACLAANQAEKTAQTVEIKYV